MTDGLTERLAADLARQEAVEAVFLAGSRARGSDDAVSDIDLLAIVKPNCQDQLTDRLEEVLSSLPDIVLHNVKRFANAQIHNLVSDDWTRVDISMQPESILGRYSSESLRSLYDPDGLGRRLKAPTVRSEIVDMVLVETLTKEFLRILGLYKVGATREDWVVLSSGASLLKDLTTRLYLASLGPDDHGGGLHLKQTLPPALYKKLEDVPAIAADQESCAVAHAVLAAIFIPLAKELYLKSSAVWPERLELASINAAESAGVSFRPASDPAI